MDNAFDKLNHSLSLENRENLEMGGIKDVTAFNEEEIIAQCDYGSVIIKGSQLHIDSLALENGSLVVHGKVSAIIYNDAPQTKGLFRRLMS
ncbi:MAG: sporulation protein YabP [Eubacterium sp.]